MKSLSIRKLGLSLALVFATMSASATVTSWSLSSNIGQTCDSITVSLSGNHFCPNDSISGITHMVVGSDIVINISVVYGFCIPPSNPPTWSTTYIMPLTGIATGNYTVKANYNSIQATTTKSLQVIACCPAQAIAGPDTNFCEQSSIQLTATPVSTGVVANWSVLSGGGTLSSTTQPNTTLSNLGYGLNEVIWAATDTASNCTERDTVRIVNDEAPTAAVTEADRPACYDTTTIKANPLTVGKGMWTSLSTGVLVLIPSRANCPVIITSPGIKTFTWKTMNGTCSSPTDTLRIDRIDYTDTPTITNNAGTLMSTSAPAYQWYKDGNPISGATNQSYVPTTSGVYQVFAYETTCNNGLFSNSIELLHVGLDEASDAEAFTIHPNPSNGVIYVSGSAHLTSLEVYSSSGQMVYRSDRPTSSLDLSALPKGLYLLHLRSKEGTSIQKLELR